MDAVVIGILIVAIAGWAIYCAYLLADRSRCWRELDEAKNDLLFLDETMERIHQLVMEPTRSRSATEQFELGNMALNLIRDITWEYLES